MERNGTERTRTVETGRKTEWNGTGYKTERNGMETGSFFDAYCILQERFRNVHMLYRGQEVPHPTVLPVRSYDWPGVPAGCEAVVPAGSVSTCQPWPCFAGSLPRHGGPGSHDKRVGTYTWPACTACRHSGGECPVMASARSERGKAEDHLPESVRRMGLETS